MKILVTGANGFIGQHLVRKLTRESNYSPIAAIRSSQKNIFTDVPTKIVGDHGPETDWSTALGGVEVVVHAAARVHVIRDSAVNPLEEFRKVNVLGVTRLAEQALECGVRRFVYISSVKVNGESTKENVPFRECFDPVPLDPYAVSKLESERLLLQLAKKSNLEVVILRPPLVYGPGVSANFLRLIILVSKGVPLPLGMINNKRSLIGIRNFTDAIIRCLEHPNANGKTFLVSDNHDISTSELVRLIARSLNKSVILIPVPPTLLKLLGAVFGRGAEVDRLINNLAVDMSLINNDIGWFPPYSLEDEIRNTVNWFQRDY